MDSTSSPQVQKIKKFLITSAFFTLILAVPLAVGAAANQNIYIGEDEAVIGNLFRAGATVEINAPVPQDLFVLGQSVVINGDVGGSVFAAGSNVRINGDVAGSVRVVGQVVEINGKVGKNVTGFGNMIILGQESEVAWDAAVYGATIELRGRINGRIDGGGAQVVIAGELAGGGKLDVDGELTVRESAIIGQTLEYTSKEPAKVASGALISGELKQLQPKVSVKKSDWKPFWWLSRITELFGLLVVGLVLVALMRKKIGEMAKQMIKEPGKSILWGLVYSIVAPVVLFLLLFTIIGIPLSVIGLVMYGISLYLSKVFAGIALGLWILSKSKKKDSLGLAMLLGLVALTIVCSIPFVGFLICLVAMWWGLGGIIRTKWEMMKGWR
ncbi:hypothetical protein KKD19_05750 [Patescibacteria group bacterium]|nr:hypothetical protein [Patescibacteria group bacterium]MBU4512708.1 hypothetical protein [Patescibacteria group bacterium]MCG2688433.1 hypothetical protein [Candidatus Parcubacteria bacterium]MCG2693169.1 hypothetical protein [Candidatus Parcubacteria bacterium]